MSLGRSNTAEVEEPLGLNRAARRRVARRMGKDIARKAIARALRDDHECPAPRRSLRLLFGWRLDRW